MPPSAGAPPRYKLVSPLLTVSVSLILVAYIITMLARSTSIISNIFRSSLYNSTSKTLNRIPFLSNHFPSPYRHLSTTPLPQMASSHIDKISFTDAVVARRSIYMLDKNLPIPDSRVKDLVDTAMKHVPSAFDSQTTRLVILLHGEHDQFWDFVWEALQPHLRDEEKKKASKGRIDGFRNAYGTVSFRSIYYYCLK